MRLAAHRLGARALGAPGGRVAALEWSQMASARRAAGRPGVRGRGPQRPREEYRVVLRCIPLHRPGVGALRALVTVVL